MNLDWKNYLDYLTPVLREPGLKRVTLGLNLVLVAMLAYSAAGITWMLVPQNKSREEATAAVTPASATLGNLLNEQAALGRDIINRHVFGMAAGGDLALNPATMPETNLQLTLRGVLASSNARIARAIIAEPGGGENYYAIGAMLPGGAALKEIHADQVILMRNGRLETLRLPKDSLQPGGGAGAGGSMPLQGSGSAGVMPGGTLRSYRDAFLQNPSDPNLLRIDPVQEGGRFIGYRIQPGRDPGLMAKLGLQPGDVVVAVDGKSLETPANRIEVMHQLASKEQMGIEILRNGVRQYYVVRLE